MVRRIKKQDHQLIRQIRSLDFSACSGQALHNCAQQLKIRVGNGEPFGDILPEAYALAAECSKRSLHLMPFNEQLLGAVFLNEPVIVQMQTGEGKTLAAAFAAFGCALQSKGVHVLTFNDYLAKRDAEWMRPFYEGLGLSVGYVISSTGREERRAAYQCDITYLTAKEAGFDYLRDCLAYDQKEIVHRGFTLAIIDEADSILIDEAGIPLVLAGNAEEGSEEEPLLRLAELVQSLEQGNDFQLDEYKRNVSFTEAGVRKAEAYFHLENLYDLENLDLLTQLNCMLHAEVLLIKNVDYIIKNQQVQLVDEYTGRIAVNRHWPDGLQEAVEAKEGLRKSQAGKVLANITIRNFLQQYEQIAGMTGTAAVAERELSAVYGLDVVLIPTHNPFIRTDALDQVYLTKSAKNQAILDLVTSVHETGRPILIGTSSIEESESLARRFAEKEISCTVLNARSDEAEAKLIAQAGRQGAVTVSTNMAGRGVDIKLGDGTDEGARRIAALGGLYVIGTSKNESLRIDQQLRGRAGRQGDPGSTIFFASLEDDMLVQFGVTEVVESVDLPTDESEKIIHKNISAYLEHIQRVIEGQYEEIRLTVNKYALMLEQQRQIMQKERSAILAKEKSTIVEKHISLITSIEAQWGAAFTAEKIGSIFLFVLDRCWVDYLAYVDEVREGIHLVSLSKEDPLFHYHRLLIEAFERMEEEIGCSAEQELEKLLRQGAGYQEKKIADLRVPTATWTYLLSDNEFLNRMKKSRKIKRIGTFVRMSLSRFAPLDFMKKLFRRLIFNNH